MIIQILLYITIYVVILILYNTVQPDDVISINIYNINQHCQYK